MYGKFFAVFFGMFFMLSTPSFGQKSSAKIQRGNVLKIDSFYMPQLNRYRSIWVYLPPDYSSSEKKYPVLYLQDGQNLFEDSTSFVGEWHLDETLDALFAQGDFGCIVVGIENGGEKRMDEYMVHKTEKYGGGEGKLYVEFLMVTLKPFIDKNYRTRMESNFTGIGGSSLGGLISFYAAINNPEIFGRALIFSPSFWIDEDLYGTKSKFLFGENRDQRYYFLAGDLEGEDEEVVKDVKKVTSYLNENSLFAFPLQEKFAPDGDHSEWFWSREFGIAYQWLFTQENTK